MSAEAGRSNVAVRGCCVKVGTCDFQPAASLVYYLEPVPAMLTVLDFSNASPVTCSKCFIIA